ncbi:HyaD/HybD family hydrogenase maturation endopeptidase [Oceanospirillum sediminis]|uniref:HyaD/HybD family hydrogenase maturation endopeptidase n=1 Tax=Oceanospirillum sediminis TaxID=2760088 RepID=A0A839IUS1_9GAMM|nr:HyaD/HybD family hydrogenase maturation endopeptidase [Oceanospirillum sediminis]MBB1488701.1 HyaD/HybD family hydrogenase maturation endopeptidase [Oceanospirillum sediminis]
MTDNNTPGVINTATNCLSETKKPDKTKVLILGIGNVLWADEGFGVRCIEALHRQYQFADNVKLMDGGTQGIYLVQHVQQADILIVFDAIDYGLEPGTMKIVRDEEVPKFMGAKQMSLHQTGFQEVLAMAEFTGDAPKTLLLVGVQPEELEDFGGSLREPVKQQVQPALDVVLDFLAGYQIVPQTRETPLPEHDVLAPGQLELARYEDERPSEDSAFRGGDARFLNRQFSTSED